MTTFAVAHLTSTRMGPPIEKYLQRIDSTLEPHGGKFVVHGGSADVLEGPWTGDLVIIEFPDHAAATGWYRSQAYQQIVGLRIDNSNGTVVLVDQVATPHRATDILARKGRTPDHVAARRAARLADENGWL